MRLLRHGFGRAVLHCKLALALRHASQLGAIAKHLAQRNHRADDNVVTLRGGIVNRTLASVDVTDHRTLELGRDGDVNFHDGFEKFRRGVVERLSEGRERRELEREFRRIDGVRGTVRQHDLDALDRVTHQAARLRRLFESFFAASPRSPFCSSDGTTAEEDGGGGGGHMRITSPPFNGEQGTAKGQRSNADTKSSSPAHNHIMSNAGGNQSFEIMPPWYKLAYII